MFFKNTQKALCSLTAVVLTAAMLATNVYADDSGTTATPVDEQKIETNYSSTDYYSYLNAHSDAKVAKDTVKLTNDAVTLENATLTSVNGVDNSVSIKQGGAATWNFNVASDAMYYVKLDYSAIDTGDKDMEIAMKIDGASPFPVADYITLKRTWEDNGEITQASNGNDIAPKIKEKFTWQTTYLEDYSNYYNGAVAVFLTAGAHSITFTANSGNIAFNNLEFNGGPQVKSYEDVEKEYEKKGYQKVGDVNVKQQAETAYEKSDSSLIAVYDVTSAATECYDGSLNDATKLCRNTIGQSRWQTPGQWISYKIDVPESGLYKLSVRAKQNTNIGMPSLRDIYVDDEIPFEEAKGFVIPYSSGWSTVTLGKDEDTPYWIYLEKGEHEIKFEATIDKFSEVLDNIEAVNSTLTQLYRRIIMVTGSEADKNRDYKVEDEIPGLMDTLQECRDKFYDLSQQYMDISGGGISQVALVHTNAKYLDTLIEEPSEIPKGLSTLQSNMSSLSDWLSSAKEQTLELDYFTLSGEDVDVKNMNSSFFKSVAFSVKRFIASFSMDYSSIDSRDNSDNDKTITVWFGGSRDQAQIIQDLIEDDFTPKTNIKVNLSLVYIGYIESILAGVGPDIALDVARSQPVAFACRNAAYDLSNFDNYDEVMSRFTSDAGVPYEYKGGHYGIPSTQAYLMMFYRSDILDELGLKVPETWDDFYDMIPTLERNNLDAGLPYATMTVSGSATGGVGAKDLYATLLMQHGGSIYSDGDLTKSNLQNELSYDAFNEWTLLYTKYACPIAYNAFTRFRTGTLPVLVATYNTYNQIMAAAPEIRGHWNIAPIPGIKREDGTINRATGATGNANVIFKNAKNKEDCWDFLDWWSSDEAQYQYAVNLESLLGVAARSTTSNVNAFNRISWDAEALKSLQEQRNEVVEIPETPGGYILLRSLDNAFRGVVYNQKNSRERFEQEVITINDELTRKDNEFKK